jgi:hypothetical protein
VLSNATVTLRSTTTVTDDLGDSTSTTVETVLDWALVAPRSSTERSDQRSPAVVTAATIYGPFGTALDADDVLIVSGHSPSMDGEWQVEGMSGDWSLGDWRPGFEVAVKRSSSAQA